MSPRFRNMMFALGVAALGSACDPYVRTTAIDLRDPSLVHYTTTLGRPIGRNGPPVVVSDDDIRYQGNHISEMIVTAEPTADGTLKTSWQTDPDVFHDERAVTFRPAASTVLPGQGSITLSPDTLTYPICGAHHDSGLHRGGEHFALALGSDCNWRKNDFEVAAVTPMSNVRSIRYEYEADRGRTVMAALVVAMLAGGAASVLLLTPTSKNGEPSADAQTGAGVVLALGGAIDVGLVLSAIFASDHEEVIYRDHIKVEP